jgi:hypothetical protein
MLLIFGRNDFFSQILLSRVLSLITLCQIFFSFADLKKSNNSGEKIIAQLIYTLAAICDLIILNDVLIYQVAAASDYLNLASSVASASSFIANSNSLNSNLENSASNNNLY